jgi:hypothetical protein
LSQIKCSTLKVRTAGHKRKRKLINCESVTYLEGSLRDAITDVTDATWIHNCSHMKKLEEELPY